MLDRLVEAVKLLDAAEGCGYGCGLQNDAGYFQADVYAMHVLMLAVVVVFV